MNALLPDIETLKTLLQAHTEITSFLCALIFGTGSLLVFATFSGQGSVSFWHSIPFCALGIYVSDGLWYLAGRTRWVTGLAKRERFARVVRAVDRLMRRLHRREWLVFVAVKFVYGIRKLAILYFGHVRFPAGRYLAFNAISVIVFSAVVGASGYLLGQGVRLFVDVFRNAQTVITAAVAVFILWQVTMKLVRRYIVPTGEDTEAGEKAVERNGPED